MRRTTTNTCKQSTLHISHIPLIPQHALPTRTIAVAAHASPQRRRPTIHHHHHTQVFLRAGQMALLDKIRTDRLNGVTTTIQRHVRGYLARVQYQRIKESVLLLQSAVRALHARRQAETLRREKAALTMQVSLAGGLSAWAWLTESVGWAFDVSGCLI